MSCYVTYLENRLYAEFKICALTRKSDQSTNKFVHDNSVRHGAKELQKINGNSHLKAQTTWTHRTGFVVVGISVQVRKWKSRSRIAFSSCEWSAARYSYVKTPYVSWFCKYDTAQCSRSLAKSSVRVITIAMAFWTKSNRELAHNYLIVKYSREKRTSCRLSVLESLLAFCGDVQRGCDCTQNGVEVIDYHNTFVGLDVLAVLFLGRGFHLCSNESRNVRNATCVVGHIQSFQDAPFFASVCRRTVAAGSDKHS